MYFIYGKEDCQYCKQAVELLISNNQPYKYTCIKGDLCAYLDQFSLVTRNQRTIPLVFKDHQFIGGYLELCEEINLFNNTDDF